MTYILLFINEDRPDEEYLVRFKGDYSLLKNTGPLGIHKNKIYMIVRDENKKRIIEDLLKARKEGTITIDDFFKNRIKHIRGAFFSKTPVF
ncbi:MAG: hypothetical protein Q9M97_06035 [Candidatus Gracilibacteria bacterium]|nr:hypothetical protein [Candidatus Gracilibacteria bacterium]